jgi:hypothetical protein
MSEEIHGPELRGLEASLAALRPAGGIDRDLVLYRAGQLSVRPRPAWGWPCATGVLAVACAALAGVAVLRPPPRPPERVAQPAPRPPQSTPRPDERGPVTRPAPEPPSTEPAPPAEERTARAGRRDRWPDSTGPRALEQQLLRWGLDAIPPPRATASVAPPLSVDGLLGAPRKRPPQSGLPFPANVFPQGGRS